MSCKSSSRDTWDQKLKNIPDAAERLVMMFKSPHKKHRKRAVEMGAMVEKMKEMVKETQDAIPVQTD